MMVFPDWCWLRSATQASQMMCLIPDSGGLLSGFLDFDARLGKLKEGSSRVYEPDPPDNVSGLT